MISEMQRVPGYVGVTATWQVIFGGSVDADQQTAINVYTAVVGFSARLFDKAQTERRKRSTPLDYIWHIR